MFVSHDKGNGFFVQYIHQYMYTGNNKMPSASLTFSFHPGTILHCGLAGGIVFALADKQIDMIVLHISLI